MKLKKLIENIYDRRIMPQVKGSDLKDAVTILKQANIPVDVEYVLPEELTYSQKTIDKWKVRNIRNSIRREQPLPPIIVSEDFFIVDGHHRQVAYSLENPNKKIKVIKIGLPRDRALRVYKKIEKYLDS